MSKFRRKTKGPKTSTVENVVGYFKEVSQTLLALNGFLPPPVNADLQRKYKVSWNTISNAKQLGYITALGNGKSSSYEMLTTVDFEKGLKIIELKNKPIAESKYKIISTNPFMLSNIYKKQGKRNYKEIKMMSELSSLLVQVFKFDRRYEKGFKPPRNSGQLFKAIERYRKVVLMWEEKKKSGKYFQPSLFSINKESNYETSNYRTITANELFDEEDENNEVEFTDPLNREEPIIRPYMNKTIDEDWVNGLGDDEDEENEECFDEKQNSENKWFIVVRNRDFNKIKKGPLEIGNHPQFNDVTYFETQQEALDYADARAQQEQGVLFYVSMISNIITYEVQIVQKNIDVLRNKN